MNKPRLIGAFCAVLFTFITLPSQAALNGVLPATPGGTDWQAYYDDVADLTWLADANYAYTSGYAETYANGLMNWTTANTWAAGLSISGVTGWRLPETNPIDGTTADDVTFAYNGTEDRGYNVSAPGTLYAGSQASEMAFLFYNTLGNKGYCDPVTSMETACSGPQSGWGLTNTDPFSNVQSYFYWSSTEFALHADLAWTFEFGGGGQDLDEGHEDLPLAASYHAWAVHDGDVGGGGLPKLVAPKKKKLVAPNGIDARRSTVVLTHGLSPQSDLDDAPDTLWTGTLSKQAGNLISGDVGDSVNIIHYVWSDGFQGNASENNYNEAQKYVEDAGANLARELLNPENLGPNYNKKIHFIGHSLGTIVNAYAARLFLENAIFVKEAQFTALDRPDHVTFKIPGCLLGTGCDGYNENFFAEIFQDLQRSRARTLTLLIDNYFSSGGAGVGDETNGINVYNHDELINPNDLDDRIFDSDDILSNNHSGVHQWYRWTMDPNGLDELYGPFGVCHSKTGELLNLDPFFDESLDPCNLGWKWSIVRQNALPFPATESRPVVGTKRVQSLDDYVDYGCPLNSDPNQIGSSVIQCVEASSPFGIANVNIPESADSLSFEYQFMNIGDGDYVAVYLDNILIWTMAGTSYLGNGFVDTGPIPIPGLSGARALKVALYGVNEPNAQFEVRNIRISQPTSDRIMYIQDKITAMLGDLDSPPPAKAMRKLEKAQQRLDKALREVVAGNAVKTLDALKSVAKELLKAKKEGVDTNPLIDELVTIAKETAESALEAALPFGLASRAVANKINKAEKEIEKVEKEIAKGHPDHAINAYKKALSHAEKAMTL